jgi:hypothetical protein
VAFLGEDLAAQVGHRGTQVTVPEVEPDHDAGCRGEAQRGGGAPWPGPLGGWRELSYQPGGEQAADRRGHGRSG